MSSLATSHTLIAAGTEDVQVRLCDIASGASTHTLSGHRGMLAVISLWTCAVLVCRFNLLSVLLKEEEAIKEYI